MGRFETYSTFGKNSGRARYITHKIDVLRWACIIPKFEAPHPGLVFWECRSCSKLFNIQRIRQRNNRSLSSYSCRASLHETIQITLTIHSDRIIHSHPIDIQRHPRHRRINWRRTPSHTIGEAPPNRQIEQNEVPMMNSLRPRRIPHIVLRHIVKRHAIHAPSQRLGAHAPIHLDHINVPVPLARRAGTLCVLAQAAGLVARSAGVDAAVQHPPGAVDAVDVLHDVVLADRRPVLVVAAVVLAEGPEGGPVARGGFAAVVGHLDAACDAHLAAGVRLEVGALGFDARGCPCVVGGAEGGDL